jgi:hypothetical protein
MGKRKKKNSGLYILLLNKKNLYRKPKVDMPTHEVSVRKSKVDMPTHEVSVRKS